MPAHIQQIYNRLFDAYGPRHWWPADSPFEVMVGAILTQNTSWRQVETAIAQLKQHHCMDTATMLATPVEILQTWIRSAGFFRQKAERLHALCRFIRQQGGVQALRRQTPAILRPQLLAVHGIGPETADSILLYALDKPVFVIDAYTRRIFRRLGHTIHPDRYHAWQQWFQAALPNDAALFNEYHALIVEHAKRHCRMTAQCNGCPLADDCLSAALSSVI